MMPCEYAVSGVVEFSFLNLGQAAIDEQLDAGNVAAVVRGEKHGGIRDLVRRAHPAHRHGGHDVRLELVELLPRPPGDVDPGRLNRARAIAFTRILWSLRSIVQQRANDRTAALLAL